MLWWRLGLNTMSSIRQCTVMIQRLVTNSTVSSERIRTPLNSCPHSCFIYLWEGFSIRVWPACWEWSGSSVGCCTLMDTLLESPRSATVGRSVWLLCWVCFFARWTLGERCSDTTVGWNGSNVPNILNSENYVYYSNSTFYENDKVKKKHLYFLCCANLEKD